MAFSAGTQYRRRRMVRFVVVTLVFALVGCDRAAPAPATTRAARPTIASTVPAATDLIVGMGGRDQLVAVSTYDRNRPDVASLPKAGDYQTADWELLATLRPTVLLTAIRPDREPAGFRDHAAALHIDVQNIQVDRLDDLAPAIDRLGVALGNPAMAAVANRGIAARLAAVASRAATRPKVPALIVYSPDATAVAGPGTYLDDLLREAGGTNVLPTTMQPWPTIDRELLLSLHPAVVLQLLPDAKPQELAQARATWAQLPSGAVGRVCTITDAYATQPGWHLPDLAEQFARCLHPSPTSAP